MNRWARILAVFAWKRRWAVYDRWAYIWDPMVYQPQPIRFERERPLYGELHPLVGYSYAGLVFNRPLNRLTMLSIQ